MKRSSEKRGGERADKRDFLTMWDLEDAELKPLFKRALKLKGGAGKGECPLIGRSVGLLFEKSSTRTRISFETGIYQLGAQSLYMDSGGIQLGRGETIADTARVLSRYLDAVVIRTFGHERAEEFARHSEVPVINALTDLHHPCQALGDMMTVLEKKGVLEGVRMAYVGDGNNVANSLIEAASRLGLYLRLACPSGYEPDPDVLKKAARAARAEIVVMRDPAEAADRADVIYTDVWTSMGQEEENEARKKIFSGYQINPALLAHAKPDAIVMHCLPAHRGEEITDEVLDGPRSVVWEQAENRLYVQKALMELLLT